MVEAIRDIALKASAPTQALPLPSEKRRSACATIEITRGAKTKKRRKCKVTLSTSAHNSSDEGREDEQVQAEPSDRVPPWELSP